MIRRLVAAVAVWLCLNVPARSMAAEQDQEPRVARISIEITKKGEVTIALEHVKDAEFEAAEGKPAALFAVPGATATSDEGFIVIGHKFHSTQAVEALGQGLRAEGGILVADTSGGRDDIGPKALLRYPRVFGFPFTVECDVVRQGILTRSQPSHAGRSLNFNFAVRPVEGHLFVTVQPTDARYTDGLVAVSWSSAGGPLTELRRASIEQGAARLQVSLPKFPEEGQIGWWLAIRGDNAHIKRLRCAGRLRPLFGLVMKSSAGQVIVTRVLEGSPASAAGIKEGDRLITVAGERVRDVPTTLELLSRTPILGSVQAEFRRDGASKTVILTAR